jgi:hypothetical protein
LLRLYEEAYVITETFHGNADPDAIRPDFRANVILHELGDYVMESSSGGDWALDLPGYWWDMHADGEFKAPWEKDPKRRAAGLARTGAVTK